MSEQYITLAEVRDLLTEEHEKRELLTSQKAAMEHARTICELSAENAKKIIEEVRTINGVTEYTAVKVADILPQYPEDVRAIFSKERITLDQKTIDRIIEVVGKYL
ncbi:RNA polymerase Rpb4 [Candidatus Methanoplasma termitum]|uniref:DNA-directed RNA polymerase subunit Rpo4 n=1 Tax=Candidatus Methanoplasma termitum TaxID=1577791 RepID=A0A0A7LER5_9ARCH|nr:RNA polymerase Rpb4 family protein [Candidatus Methanoplasma termitum]AIZ56011.1 RNA polymerase Rpb4 [Candidatus Methanoplasma termitum]MCL2333645.1 RNA polymerase Rpb4 family protein [Candidatus Methanoplasma sp.]